MTDLLAMARDFMRRARRGELDVFPTDATIITGGGTFTIHAGDLKPPTSEEDRKEAVAFMERMMKGELHDSHRHPCHPARDPAPAPRARRLRHPGLHLCDKPMRVDMGLCLHCRNPRNAHLEDGA